jgi:hypothetical protein
MKHHKQRPKGSGDDNGENLRGRVRTLEKQIEIQKRHIRSLEKRLTRGESNDINSTSDPAKLLKRLKKKHDRKAKVEEEIDKSSCCPQCSSPNYVLHQQWTPGGSIDFSICQECKFREKKKIDAK